jgi:SAM-dependent methyltransferase
MSLRLRNSARLSLSERLLLLLSRKPGAEDPPASREEWNLENALSQLRAAFPDFDSLIAGKDVLDFGCGEGWQAVALAQNGARFVLGLDSNAKTLAKARQLAQQAEVGGGVEFAEKLNGDARLFDLVISQNSMEHFPDPAGALEEMKRALKPDGKILITFGPPWFAPYGSHMAFFTKVPWVNLLFSEKTVTEVRRRFRNDGAGRYEDVESGLNKMTVRKFERSVSVAGLRAEFRRYRCVKDLDALARLPVVRELLVNQVDCVVTRRNPPEHRAPATRVLASGGDRPVRSPALSRG